MARHGLYKAWIFSIILKRRAKLFEGGIKASVEIHVRALGPQSLSKLFPSDNLAALTEQQFQNTKGLLLNPEADTLASERTPSQIYLK